MKLFPSKQQIRDRVVKTPSELHGVPKQKKNLFRENLRYIVGIAVATPVLFLIYFLLVGLEYYFIDFVYMGLLTVLAIVYVVYNKGFRASQLTYEQLPPDMPDEKKRKILEERDSHIQKSKWMLVFLIPLTLVLLVELFIMHILPLFGG